MVYLRWSFEQELKLLKDVSLGAMSLFSGLFAIVGTAILIPKDIEDRTLYTILSKPVPRYEYLLGKLLGVLSLIAVSLVIMQILFSAVLYVRQEMVLDREITKLDTSPPLGVYTPEALAEVKAETRRIITKQGLNANLLNATLSIFLKATVMTSVVLFLSTFASSTLFTIISGFAIYIIGHLQPLARDFFLEDGADGITRVISVVVAIIFPDLKVFDIVDDVAAGELIPAAVMIKMVGLGGLYVLIYSLGSIFLSDPRHHEKENHLCPAHRGRLWAGKAAG